MLFANRKALNVKLGIETPKEVLTYGGGSSNGVLYSVVKNSKGDILFTSTLGKTADTMVVTDYRNKRIVVKEEQISLSNSLKEVEADMRKLGYITETQELKW